MTLTDDENVDLHNLVSFNEFEERKKRCQQDLWYVWT